MKLKRFKKEETKRKKVIKIFGAFIVVGILFLVGISYAVYKRETEVTFINAKVGDFRVYLNNFQVSSVTSNAITLEYFAFDVYDLNTTVTCKYGTNSGNYTSTASKVSNEKCEITGLNPETVYYYQVCAKNKLNQEVCYEGVERTSYGAPSISDITAYSTGNYIELHIETKGVVEKTTCKYGTTSGKYNSTGNTVGNNSCYLENLNSGTTYYYQVCVSNNAGEKCETGSYTTKSQFFLNLNYGDYIKMTPTSTSYIIPAGVTGYQSSQTINPSELNLWRVIRKNEDGTVEAVSEYTSTTDLKFYGMNGYLNLIGALNTISAQYTDGKHVIRTRHIGYSNQTETITDSSKIIRNTLPWTNSTDDSSWTECDTSSYLCGTDEALGAGDRGFTTDYRLVNEVYGSMAATTPDGDASTYVIASRYFFNRGNNRWDYSYRSVNTVGGLTKMSLYTYDTRFTHNHRNFRIRPIITLKSDSVISSGKGTKASPYVLE